uniref:Uncharacterized protein n=1 Tax=Nelumbo nucifera TaxID=4432 RepID=A0A822XWF9_NELNU|nr:TPA_asm: hypothetical protein HUJ06_027442 [Nelumbo nucifera]
MGGVYFCESQNTVHLHRVNTCELLQKKNNTCELFASQSGASLSLQSEFLCLGGLSA